MSEAIEILTPVGRIVGGHPMIGNPVLDDRTNQPKLDNTGNPRTEYYFALAIPKQGEQAWSQTDWGAKIHQAAQMGWPNGEHAAPTFAWKIVDGDSTIPNKAGKVPAQREGWAGHWVLHLATGIPVRCYHVGKYDPTQQIQNKDEIKPGDYGRACIMARGNAPSQSPGVYLNPSMFELSRAGQLIVLDSGPDAASVFGGQAPAVPANAAVDTGVQQTPPPAAGAVTPPPAGGDVQPPVTPPAEPHRDFLNPAAQQQQTPPPERKFQYQGQVYAESQLRGWGWNDAQINSLPPAV